MASSRRRTAAITTIVALAGLGGVALESNHGAPVGASTPVAAHAQSSPLVTSTSGGGAAVQPTPTAAPVRVSSVPRIVTRASGAPAFVERDDE